MVREHQAEVASCYQTANRLHLPLNIDLSARGGDGGAVAGRAGSGPDSFRLH
jgi:hypothetical protein